MSNKLRVQVFADGDHLGDQGFDIDIIKVGRLPSSHLYLDGDGVARMHAVIERAPSGDYRIIDLGTIAGSYLNGERVHRDSLLPRTGTLKFGSFEIKFETDQGPAEVEPPEDAQKARFTAGGSRHHETLCRSLLGELERLGWERTEEARRMVLGRWESLSTEKRNRWLRLFVETIRNSRAAHRLVERKRVATMLHLGMAGMEAIFKLTPEEALERAQEVLMEMALSKSSLELFNSMGLLSNLEAAFEKLPPQEREAQLADLKGFQEAHAKLEDRLQTAIVAASSLLPAYLARAGGREATDTDRFQWKAAFDQIKAMSSKGPNEAN